MSDKDTGFDLRDSEVRQESWIENSPVKVTTPSPLRASNTLESLRPREVNPPLRTLTISEGVVNALGAVLDDNGVPHDTGEFELVRKTDNSVKYANVLPVNWPASSNKPPKPVILPSVYDRVTKLEEQVDALLDRIALHNVRSSHKI